MNNKLLSKRINQRAGKSEANMVVSTDWSMEDSKLLYSRYSGSVTLDIIGGRRLGRLSGCTQLLVMDLSLIINSVLLYI